MKKVTTHYNSIKKLKGQDAYFFVHIELSHENTDYNLKANFDTCWRTKSQIIAYLKWCIEEVEGLDV